MTKLVQLTRLRLLSFGGAKANTNSPIGSTVEELDPEQYFD